MSDIYTPERLKELQSMPLEEKIEMTKDRIEDWYMQFYGNVYVYLSGGKDSTVLLHIVRSIFPEVPAVFCDTGLEYPEIRQFVRSIPNVKILYPKMTFPEVIKTYGYPLVSKEVAEAIHYARKSTGKEMYRRKAQLSVGRGTKTAFQKREELTGGRRHVGAGEWEQLEKPFCDKSKWFLLATKAPFKISHYCCNVMKKQPASRYHTESSRVPYLGTMAEESHLRKQAWLRHGCNAFHASKQTSQPMSFWTEQDVLHYIKKFNLRIVSVYGEIVSADGQMSLFEETDDNLTTTGCKRTGCVFCGFGAHLEKGESRFQRLKRTHPKQYDYCIGGGEWISNSDYIEGLSEEPDELGWVAWNPKEIWIPNKKGLGMGKVFDIGNELYGKEMWRY